MVGVQVFLGEGGWLSGSHWLPSLFPTSATPFHNCLCDPLPCTFSASPPPPLPPLLGTSAPSPLPIFLYFYNWSSEIKKQQLNKLSGNRWIKWRGHRQFWYSKPESVTVPFFRFSMCCVCLVSERKKMEGMWMSFALAFLSACLSSSFDLCVYIYNTCVYAEESMFCLLCNHFVLHLLKTNI